jgi:ketosteroid isomerase-like protein
MNMLRKLCMILPMLLILTGPIRAGEPRGLSDRDIAAIKAAEKAWGEAALARDWEKASMFYTADAIILPPNAAAIEGRENIRKHFGTFPPLSKLDISVLETRGEGHLAYVRGAYTMTVPQDKSAPITETGKFIEIRLRQPNGEWLISRDMYSSDGAPAPAPPGASKP